MTVFAGAGDGVAHPFDRAGLGFQGRHMAANTATCTKGKDSYRCQLTGTSPLAWQGEIDRFGPLQKPGITPDGDSIFFANQVGEFLAQSTHIGEDS